MAGVLETLMVLIRSDSSQMRRELDAAERESRQTGQNIRRNLDFRDVASNLTGLTGGGGLLYALRSMAQESAQTAAAVRTYENSVERAGASQEAAGAMVNRLADKFGILESDVQSAAGQLLKAGLDINTIESTLTSLGASGALVGSDIAQSMQQGAEGIAYQRSELLELAGVASNASDGYKEMAASLGVTVEQLTAQQKATAYARQIIRETAPDVADFADTFGDYARSQADASREASEFRNRVGEIAQQGIVPLNQGLSGLLGFVNDLPEGTLRTATAFVAAGAGATTLAAGVGTLALLLAPLGGPAGLFILVAAGVAAFAAASQGAPAAVKPMETAIDDLKEAHEELLKAVNNTSDAEREASRKRLENAIITAQAAARVGRLAIAEEKSNAVAGLQAGGFDPEKGFFDETTGTFRPTDEVLEGNAKVRAVREQYQELRAEVVAAQGDLQAFDDLVARSLNGAPGKTNPPSSEGPVSNSKRTITDVFSDLEKAGTVSQQFAEALGTPEAKLEDLQNRAGLMGDALREAFELKAGEDQLEYLRQRLADLTTEANTLNRELGRGSPRRGGSPASPEVIAAQREAQDSRSPEAIAAAQEEIDLRRIRNAQAEAQRSQQLAVNLQAVREKALEASEQIGSDAQGLLSGLVSGFETLVGSVGRATRQTDAILAQLERDAGYTGTGPDSSGTNAAQDTEDRGRRAFLANYLSNTSYTGIGSDSTGYDLNAASNELPELEVNPDPFADAGQQFLDGLVGVFNNAANQLGQAIGSGDFSEMSGGDILGSIFNLGAGAASAAGGPAGIIAGLGLSLLGGIFQGLGDSGEADSRSKAAKDLERRGGAAEVNINAYVTQYNTFDAPITDPQTDIALDRQIRKVVRSMFDELDLGNRLNRALPARSST